MDDHRSTPDSTSRPSSQDDDDSIGEEQSRRICDLIPQDIQQPPEIQITGVFPFVEHKSEPEDEMDTAAGLIHESKTEPRFSTEQLGNVPQTPRTSAIDWKDYRKISAPPWSDPWSLAAQRLYRAISNQHKYTDDEAIGILLREVETHKDSDLSESKLVEKLRGVEEEPDGRKPSRFHLGRTEEEEDEEESAEREQEGFGASQLATVARFLSFSATSAPDLYSLSNVFERYVDKSSVDSLIEYALSKLREQWRTLLQGFFPVQHVQTMLLVCVVQIITVNRLIHTLPIIFSYVTFMTMVYSTLRMFHNRHQMKQLEVWQRLLRAFNPYSPPMEKTGIQRSFYSWASLEPYVNFFMGLFAFVLCFGLCGKYLPNCLLLCGISCFFLLLCFVALTDRYDSTAVVILILNLVSHGPVLERKFGIRNMFSAVLSSSFSVDFGGWVSFNLGVSSVALLLIPVIYLVMIVRQPQMEVYKVAVPHMVCLAWSETAISLFLAGQMSYEVANILLTAGVISLLFWPTGAGLALVGGLIVAQLKSSTNALSMLKAFLTLCILMLPFAYGKIKVLIFKKYGIWQDAGQKKKRAMIVLVFYVILVLTSVSVLYHGSAGPGVEKDVRNLSWTKFEKECGAAARRDDNQISSQILCSELKGTAVNWTGSIQSIRISKIDNSLEALLDYLPNALANFLRCFYAKRDSHPGRRKWNLSPSSCSLSAHHLYTFEMEVVGPWGEQLISTAKGSVVLTASSLFKEMLEFLGEGDVVKFVAFFDQYPVLRYPSRMRLLKLDCVTCRKLMEDKRAAAHLVSVSDRSLYRGFWSKMCYALKYSFNFVFAPLFYIPA